MSENPCFRTPFDNQHVNQCDKLHHSTFVSSLWNELLLEMSFLVVSQTLGLFVNTFHIVSSLCQKLSQKMYALVISKILGVFVNTYTADGKYSLRNWSFFLNQFKCNYIKNSKFFLNFLLYI